MLLLPQGGVEGWGFIGGNCLQETGGGAFLQAVWHTLMLAFRC